MCIVWQLFHSDHWFPRWLQLDVIVLDSVQDNLLEIDQVFVIFIDDGERVPVHVLDDVTDSLTIENNLLVSGRNSEEIPMYS